MTRRITLTLALTLLAALAGCTPGGQETPTPEPTVYTPVPSPTPSWNAVEQGAIDAVQKYLEVWTDISQNLQTADWYQIRDVASDPAASDAFTVWAQWNQNGWHLVGAPTLDVDRVDEGATDSQGTRYHVHGCFSISEGYLLDIDGNRVTNRGTERGTTNYLVLHQKNERYVVLEDNPEDESC